MSLFRSAAITAALVLFGLGPAMAQEVPMEGPVTTTALINADSKNNMTLDPAMLKLDVNGHGTPIDSLVPVSSGSVELAILIDDGLRGSFGLQLQEMEKFVSGLPPNVGVLIGYMQNGTVRSSGHFSADHGETLDALRVPLSAAGMSASPYFCLSDFVKRWPSSRASARFVIMITNGVDPYNGSVSPLNQDSPYVQQAQTDAQRAGVAVYSIYYGDTGVRGGAASFSGQGYLQQIGEATGGQSLYNGTITPPSLTPFFNQFNKAMAESYLVGFKAVTHNGKNDLAHIKLKTSQSGVKLHAPDGVRPGLAE